MASELPRKSERYLERLERALWPLGSAERGAILLELRGHLAAPPSGEQAALDALGPPEGLAAAFLAEGAGEGGPIAVPDGETPRRLSLYAVLSQALATWRAARPGMFVVGAVLLTALVASNWALFTLALRPSESLPAWAVMLARTAAVLAAFCAAYRLLLSPAARPWRVDPSMLRFGAAMLAIVVLSAGVAVLAVRGAEALLHAAGANGGSLAAGRAAAAFAGLAAAALLFLRTQPWLAALAAGRSELGLAGSWRGTSGRMSALAKGWAVLVLPLYALHFAFSYAAVKLFPLGVAQLAFAGLDGIASTAMALAAVTLNATAFRWAAGEPTPSPPPFASEAARPELVEAARLRLSQLVGPPVRAG
jgi:hypothetical protein